MDGREYSVSEAVRLIGVESHVLRYWEEELHVAVSRNSQGHRIYSEENVVTFRRVKELKEKGIQLKAIRVLLEESERPEKMSGEAGTGEIPRDRIQEIARMLEQEHGSGCAQEDPEEDRLQQITERGKEHSDDREEGACTEERACAKESACTKERVCVKEGACAEESVNAGKDAGVEKGADTEAVYEIVIEENRTDALQKFEEILKSMLAEIVVRENERLEQALTERIREELEDLFFQYADLAAQEAATERAMQEAAAAQENRTARGGIRKRLMRMLAGLRKR